MTKTTSLKQIAQLVGGELVGNGDIPISGVKGIEQAKPGDITFLAHSRYRDCLDTTQAAAIIAPPQPQGLKQPYIVVANPYLALAKVLEYFYGAPHPAAGIHPLAVLGKNPQLGKGVCIYPWAVLGDGVCLAQGVVVYPGAYIGDGVRVGAQTKIHSQVSIYPGVTIGRKVIIHSGSVIGSPGFGYVWDGERHHRIPQVGGVVIEDEAEIGANVTIDRGTMGDTHIGRGVKIDNLVQIAHNVVIGEHSIVVAQVGIAGSARIGRRVSLGGQVGVVGHIQIGDQVQVAAKAGVSKDVPPGSVIAGIVGVPYAEWKRSEAAVRRLPQLQTKLRALERRLKVLENREA